MSYMPNFSPLHDYQPPPRVPDGPRYLFQPPRLRGAVGLAGVGLLACWIGLLGLSIVAGGIQRGVMSHGGAIFIGFLMIVGGFLLCGGFLVLAKRYARNALAFKCAKAQVYFGRS